MNQFILPVLALGAGLVEVGCSGSPGPSATRDAGGDRNTATAGSGVGGGTGGAAGGAPAATGNEFWISPTGKDTNAGTKDAPLFTLCDDDLKAGAWVHPGGFADFGHGRFAP